MKREYLSVFFAFLSSRLISSIFVYFGHSYRPYLADVPGGWRGVENWWLNPWTTYDSVWLLEIASKGYQEHTTAFFPLYPYILRLLGSDLVSMALAGVIISHISLLAGLIFTYLLTKEEFGIETARNTVWLMAFWPTAAYYGAVYTESLFMLLLAMTFLALKRSQWLLASLPAGLAAASRNPGLLVGISMFFYPFPGKDSKSSKWTQKIITACVPILVFIFIQAWFWSLFASPLTGIESQEYFHRHWDWPWSAVLRDISSLFANHSFLYKTITSVSLITTCMAFAMVIFGWRKVKFSYLLLIGGITLMNLTYARGLGPHTISEIRYMGALFPFIQMLVVFFSKEYIPAWSKKILVALYLYVFILFGYLFGTKAFLG